jgi:stage III sporulation protein SpoIIIAA
MTQRRITDDLPVLFAVLPVEYINAVTANNNLDDLLEIIMDLGRLPMARFVDREFEISSQEVTREQIDEVVSRIGSFDADNRAGIERTLHRISAIRNKLGAIVGLTCRVGRAVYGTIDIIEDLILSGKSLLLLGRPGVGKTTMLREAARILAEKTRVVIVDTSNEIGGDGDVPHPAVGRARRMQVSQPSLQHEVMIEAVENHNPEVIVIDEIGRELEAAAARTIAERGVQLVATAHGRTLENLLLNPTLSDLVGGIESVTLSDEEARRRGTQKTVLERRAPPTFDVLIEIQERSRLAVHEDVAEAVDNLLRGFTLEPESRYRDDNDEIRIERPVRRPAASQGGSQGMRRLPFNGDERSRDPRKRNNRIQEEPDHDELIPEERHSLKPVSIFAYGVARNRLEQSAGKLGVPARMAKDLNQADVMITLKAYYRKRQRPIMDAEERGVPIYVLRSNTINQIDQALVDLFNLSTSPSRKVDMNEVGDQVQSAITTVLSGQRWVDLPPAPARVRRLQHEMVRDAELISHSYGKEPNRRVRIFRE